MAWSESITCDIDAFAVNMEKLLGDIPQRCGDALDKTVRSTARETASKLRGEYTAGIGIHEWSDEYRSGFSSHVEKSGIGAVGEIGNKNKPGLVHLLEKGHVTPAGRRTRSFKHMEPAFVDMEERFVESAKRNVLEAL